VIHSAPPRVRGGEGASAPSCRTLYGQDQISGNFSFFISPFCSFFFYLRRSQVEQKSTGDSKSTVLGRAHSTVLVKIVTEILFCQCDFGEAMKQLSWSRSQTSALRKKTETSRMRILGKSEEVDAVGQRKSFASTLVTLLGQVSPHHPLNFTTTWKTQSKF